MQKSLETGYVEGARIIDAVSRELCVPTPWSDDEHALQPLTRYWDIADVWKMLSRGWIKFDFADKVLCVLHLTEVWTGGLADIYYACHLDAGDRKPGPRRVPRGHKRCECRGCTQVFKIEHTPQGGGRPKKFCSKKCRVRENNYLQRDKVRIGRYGTKYGECVNGHDRSPENTYISPGGKVLCRPCARDNAKKTRARKRAMKEAA